ncbi:MAG: metallophosphoesterase family protein [Gemmatimonadota bacterium]
MNILQISDLHFGPHYHPEVGEALLRAAREIEADAIVVSGDFTQRAKPAEYEAARTFLGELPELPTIVTPGNHDVPLYRVFERLFAPYQLYRQHIARELDTVHRFEEAVIVALNSTAPLRAIVNGRIRRWQLDFVAEAFENVPEDVARIVVAHHHFAPAPDYEGGQVMPRARRALDRFNRLKVDMIIGGHLHRAYIGNSLDVYPGADREHGIIIVQSGTTTSRRGRAREAEKNSFNHIRVAEGAIRVTHYMYFSDVAGFAPVSRHLFPRAGTHYLREAAL